MKTTYKDTVMRQDHDIELATKQEWFIVRIKTYIFGGGDVTKQHKRISEKEIFDSYNDGDECFFMGKDDKGYLKIGFGHGGMLGGLDKELIFKAVTKEVYDSIGQITEKRKEIEKIKDKHNFLFGDSNQEMMDKAQHMKYELSQEISELTGWW